MKPFKIEIYADVVCPWCYVGKRNIESALEYYRRAYPDERQPEVYWRPFLLHASVPKEGLDRKEYLKRRFPGNANSPEMFASVSKAGRLVGLEYQFDLISRQPNTVDAHRLIHYAGSYGTVDKVVETLFNAYFMQGKDISQTEFLIETAVNAGMQAQQVKAYLASDQDVEWVYREDRRAKKQLGVTTVPFMVLNGRKGFSAMQSVDPIFRALEWARRDSVRPKWWPSFL